MHHSVNLWLWFLYLCVALPVSGLVGQRRYLKFPADGVGSRASSLDAGIQSFLSSHPGFRLGGPDFLAERSRHLSVFGIHSIPEGDREKIGKVENVVLPDGPNGSVPLRLFYPSTLKPEGKRGALLLMHGGGYTVGSLDEFEQGYRLIAESSGLIVVGIEYHLAPEWKFPTQLDEYHFVLHALRGEFGKARGVDPALVAGGGDSAGGNLSAALALRLRDLKEANLKAQILLYPEARTPFDTKACVENNSGYYLECNGIFSFAFHYLPLGVPPSIPYISPGTQPVSSLHSLPPAAVFTCGFDPLRDVGIQYAQKLDEAGNEVVWNHYPSFTHGFIQLTRWSEKAREATVEVGRIAGRLVYGNDL